MHTTMPTQKWPRTARPAARSQTTSSCCPGPEVWWIDSQRYRSRFRAAASTLTYQMTTTSTRLVTGRPFTTLQGCDLYWSLLSHKSTVEKGHYKNAVLHILRTFCVRSTHFAFVAWVRFTWERSRRVRPNLLVHTRTPGSRLARLRFCKCTTE